MDAVQRPKRRGRAPAPLITVQSVVQRFELHNSCVRAPCSLARTFTSADEMYGRYTYPPSPFFQRTTMSSSSPGWAHHGYSRCAAQVPVATKSATRTHEMTDVVCRNDRGLSSMNTASS